MPDPVYALLTLPEVPVTGQKAAGSPPLPDPRVSAVDIPGLRGKLGLFDADFLKTLVELELPEEGRPVA